MSYIETLIPGQISIGNQAPIVASGAVYAPGQGAKIEGYQMNETLAASHAHMPNPYKPNDAAHAGTIFGELDRYAWLKFILVPVDWGTIESNSSTRNWEYLRFILDTVVGLPKATGQNKKVMFLLSYRNFSISSVADTIPADLDTQNTGVNGGYYKNTTTFPPSETNPPVNAKKYDHLWCYEGAFDGSTTVVPKGYNLNLYKFTAAAGTNTLKTRYYAFLQALADEFSTHPAFAGIVTTESALGSPFVAYESGNSRNAHYEGRLNIMKQIRSVFPSHVVAECASFDNAYYAAMTNAGAADGVIVNRLAFATPDLHTGTNLNLGNINPVLRGKVPIVMQVQPLSYRSMSGNRSQYYNWPTNPAQKLSALDNDPPWNDPPTMQWLFDRLRYYNSNLAIMQRNLATGGNNWNNWVAFMNGSVASPNGGLLRNDPLGGMDGSIPQFIGQG